MHNKNMKQFKLSMKTLGRGYSLITEDVNGAIDMYFYNTQVPASPLMKMPTQRYEKILKILKKN